LERTSCKMKRVSNFVNTLESGEWSNLPQTFPTLPWPCPYVHLSLHLNYYSWVPSNKGEVPEYSLKKIFFPQRAAHLVLQLDNCKHLWIFELLVHIFPKVFRHKCFFFLFFTSCLRYVFKNIISEPRDLVDLVNLLRQCFLRHASRSLARIREVAGWLVAPLCSNCQRIKF
jgi:hypothetical protein